MCDLCAPVPISIRIVPVVCSGTEIKEQLLTTGEHGSDIWLAAQRVVERWVACRGNWEETGGLEVVMELTAPMLGQRYRLIFVPHPLDEELSGWRLEHA